MELCTNYNTQDYNDKGDWFLDMFDVVFKASGSGVGGKKAGICKSKAQCRSFMRKVCKGFEKTRGGRG